MTNVCIAHDPRQHRDGKPPWCANCGLTRNFKTPVSRLSRVEVKTVPLTFIDDDGEKHVIGEAELFLDGTNVEIRGTNFNTDFARVIGAGETEHMSIGFKFDNNPMGERLDRTRRTAKPIRFPPRNPTREARVNPQAQGGSDEVSGDGTLPG